MIQMARRFSSATVAVLAGWLGACTLLADLSELRGGPDDPDPGVDGAAPPPSGDAASRDGGRSPIDGGSDPSDSGGEAYRPRYHHAITIQNRAAAPLASGSTQCLVMDVAADARAKVRPDLGDVRVFGPLGSDRPRAVDFREQDTASICFSLERAIAPGGSDAYALRFGDPKASPPPPAEASLFSFWEPFDGTNLASRWLVNGTATVSGGHLTLPAGAQNAVTTIASKDGIPLVASLEIRARVVDPSSDGYDSGSGRRFYFWLGFQHEGDFDAYAPWSIFVARAPNQIRAEHATTTGVCEDTCASGTGPLPSDFRVYRIDRLNEETIFTDPKGVAFTGQGTSGDESVMIRNWLLTSDVVVDWVRARPTVDPPPLIAVEDGVELPP